MIIREGNTEGKRDSKTRNAKPKKAKSKRLERQGKDADIDSERARLRPGFWKEWEV